MYQQPAEKSYKQELEEQLAVAEKDIETHTATLSFADSFARLRENPDFIRVFQEDYLNKYPTRLAVDMESGRITEEQRQGYLRGLTGVGQFSAYCQSIVQHGISARASLEAAYKSKEEALYELSRLDANGNLIEVGGE